IARPARAGGTLHRVAAGIPCLRDMTRRRSAPLPIGNDVAAAREIGECCGPSCFPAPAKVRHMTDYRFCTVEDDGRVRIVTINRPEVLNALHSEAHWEFDRVWNEFSADPNLWVGIITGAGDRAFSAGNDLKVQAAGRRGP